jgi:SAM-dependent methyltransferase
VTPEHPGDPFFERVAARLGKNYLRYSFTKGTQQEVSFLLDILDLAAGARLLDVGCGPGRHAIEFARAGLAVTGVDVSREFLDIAAENARAAGVGAGFFVCDARRMPFDDEFDAVISLCQGGFGLMGDDDSLVLRRMAESARSGGRVVVTAANAYFVASHVPEGAKLDAESGILYERTAVMGENGSQEEVDLWTSVYSPRELKLLAIGVGLLPEQVWGVDPGDYAQRQPDTERAELMLVARKP